jgi:hypothetical protein
MKDALFMPNSFGNIHIPGDVIVRGPYPEQSKRGR